jgi:NADPH:quinone reductase-like Zn-dependent oxidoreductase
MLAAVVTGGSIRIQSVSRPMPHAGEVLVKVHFAGVNPADWKRASGIPEDSQVGKPGDGRPAIPGLDASGVIDAVGPGVSEFKLGDAVMLWSRGGGTYAQYVAVRAEDVIAKPAQMPFAQAAAIPHASLAAWNLLVDVAKVHKDQTVLVIGGAGGVGSAAVQIARLEGARVVATASARNLEYLRSLGAQTAIDYTSQHFEEQLRNVDIAVNAVDVDNAYRGLAVVRRGGYLVSVAGLPAADQCAARGVICSARTANGTAARVALEQLTRWYQMNQFGINLDRTFEFADVLQAWAYSQAGHTRGKTVIRIGE